MTRSSRRSIEVDQTASFQDTIEDSGRHIVVVEYLAPLPQGFIGGKDHGSLSQVPVIDHMEQDVGGIGSIGQVAELVDHQYMRVGVGYKRLLETSFLAGIGEILDEFGCGCEQSFEAILDRSIPDGNRQMGLTEACLAEKDQRPALEDEVRSQVGAEKRQTESRLPCEVELVDGLEEGEVRTPNATLETGLFPSRYFFRRRRARKSR